MERHEFIHPQLTGVKQHKWIKLREIRRVIESCEHMEGNTVYYLQIN